MGSLHVYRVIGNLPQLRISPNITRLELKGVEWPNILVIESERIKRIKIWGCRCDVKFKHQDNVEFVYVHWNKKFQPSASDSRNARGLYIKGPAKGDVLT